MEAVERRRCEYIVKESTIRVSSKKINIQGLKHWADSNLPRKSQIRKILQLEKDVMSQEDFLTKIDLWLKIFDMDVTL
jgi:hypothetical protein